MQDNLLDIKPLEYEINGEEGVNDIQDPLSLDISNEEIVEIVDTRSKLSEDFYEKFYNLKERRRKNEIYRFGRQVGEKEKNKELKMYEARYLDNVIYEIENSIDPLLKSKMPDIMVSAGPGKGINTDEADETAANVSTAINTDLHKREIRSAVSVALRHHPVYFTACIKAIWDPAIDDYKFITIHPNNITLDHTCTTHNADDMGYICEYVPSSIQEVIAKFPKAEHELRIQLEKDGIIKAGNENWKSMATEIKYKEVWFDWLKEKSGKWEKVCGVIWKYKDVVLGKIKNPNYDYEGEEQYFIYDDMSQESSKRQMTAEEMMGSAMTGVEPMGAQTETIYHNYFQFPRKPYYFFGYDQFGKVPIDETSRIEQNINNQQNMDDTGKQIIQENKNRGKHIFSKMAGLDGETLEQMDMNDPDQDILVDNDVQSVHKYITPERASPQEYGSLNDSRSRMYAVAGASAVRGQIQSDVATTNQIAREADFTRADDLAEETINACFEWMAQWALQFIKLRYTKDHWRKILGDKGVVTYFKLNRDVITDGMEVGIKASGTDKLKTQRNAMEMLKAGIVDPYNFYKDMDISNPEKRVEALITFQSNPLDYLMRIVQKLSQEELAAKLMTSPLPNGASPMPGTTSPEGNGASQPGQPSPSNTSAIQLTPPTQVAGSGRMI
jgi:hypothetical protein